MSPIKTGAVVLVVVGVGVAYWIGTLPGIRKSATEITVVGCDGARSENAAGVCPHLYCEKALLEQPEIGRTASVE